MNQTLIELTKIVENTLGITLTDKQKAELIYSFEEPVTSVSLDAHMNGIKKGMDEAYAKVLQGFMKNKIA